MNPIRPITQVEETIFNAPYAKNGAGPYWNLGGSQIVRRGGRLFCAGTEALPGEVILNNIRWYLMTRRDGDHAWERIYTDYFERSREPSPIALTDAGLLTTSANPTLTPPGQYSGPARPMLHAFDVSRWPPTGDRINPITPIVSEPAVWDEAAPFSEHSYRSLAVDPATGNAALFNNIGYDYAHWAFREGAGRWTASGKIHWPRHVIPQGEEVPLRVCYPSVILKGKAVHFFGISDIVEFDPALKALKFKLTGSAWDYVFCRMFYAYTPDITNTPFSPWLEVANVEATRGSVLTGDLHVDDSGAVHMLWHENNVAPHLRDAAFPGVPILFKSQYARVRGGKIEKRLTVFERGTASTSGFQPNWPRFHHTPSGRRLVVASGTFKSGRLGESEQPTTVLREIMSDDTLGPVHTINLTQPLSGVFFTTTPRSGSKPSQYLDLMGPSSQSEDECRYARVLIAE